MLWWREEDEGALVEGIAEEGRSSKKKVREDRDVMECRGVVGRKISLKNASGQGGIDMLSPRGRTGLLEHG